MVTFSPEALKAMVVEQIRRSRRRGSRDPFGGPHRAELLRGGPKAGFGGNRDRFGRGSLARDWRVAARRERRFRAAGGRDDFYFGLRAKGGASDWREDFLPVRFRGG